MLTKAYEAQCASATAHCTDEVEIKARGLGLFALALGSFCIGTSEFASMGILQLFSESLGIDVPTATNAVAAYAFGVVVGAPLLTMLAARLNRRTLLLGLSSALVLGNVLSAVAMDLGQFAVARFITGLPQGAYFGAGAVVASFMVGPGRGGQAFALVMSGLTAATIVGSPLATFLGQTVGWRNTYLAVAALAVLAFLSLWMWIPRNDALRGGSIRQELGALKRPAVWGVMAVAALGIASIFAVYTFIGPFTTEVVGLNPSWIPLALAVFGLGMMVGNVIGGRLADAYPARGVIAGFCGALLALAILGLWGNQIWLFFPALFGVGAATMAAIPTIQVRLTRAAPEAPTLMGAMNLAALNVANAIGAWAGGLAIAAGLGWLSAAWAGLMLTSAGLILFGLMQSRTSPSLTA